MIFEFVCGFLPFADDAEDPTVICTAVLTETLTFPDRYQDEDGRALISALLTRNPKKRLGSGFRAADIKAHTYFRINDGNPEELFDKMMGRDFDPPIPQKGEAFCSDEEAQAASLSDAEELWPQGNSKEPNSTKKPDSKEPVSKNANPK